MVAEKSLDIAANPYSVNSESLTSLKKQTNSVPVQGNRRES